MKAQQKASAGEATATELAGQEPSLDLNTVRYAISRARGQSSLPLDHLALSGLETELCGYIARMLPPARKAAHKLWQGGIARHERTARLDGIERQVEQGLSEGVLSAHVQVQQLAKDCQWLLDHRGQPQ